LTGTFAPGSAGLRAPPEPGRDRFRESGLTMRLMRYSTGAALAALLVVAAVEPSSAQTAPSPASAQVPAAGALNPAAEEAPQRATPAPQFRMADGIIATVNDRIITGFDLRQRMLVLMA